METFFTYAILSAISFLLTLGCTLVFSLISASPNGAGYLDPNLSNSKIKVCSFVSLALVIIWACAYPRHGRGEQCDVLLVITVTHLLIGLLMQKASITSRNDPGDDRE